ncbi:MAG: hypothetical protein HYS59_00340 [Candidatus Vogelbacteria bacterium]|nr:hypothetical protein [Candidatus Vogelbacteria bacterium]
MKTAQSRKESKINWRGFLLIYAALISGIILTVGTGIIGITVRALQLSSSGRESVRAFFAADMAVECVLFWDLRYELASRAVSPFATSTASTPPTSGIECNGTDIAALWSVNAGPSSAATTFSFTQNDGDGIPGNDVFTEVRVEKIGTGVTTITASGYNTSDTTFLRRVQRTLVVQY